MNVNKAFLKYFDANDLGSKSNDELVEIRAAFVAGFNHYARVIDDLKEIVESGDAPAYGELKPNDNLVDDYYCRIIYRLFKEGIPESEEA